MTWIDALEWICVFFIMTIIFFTVRYERRHNNALAFGKRWSALGLTIGILGLFEFLSDLMRFSSWVTYIKISFVISIINMWILVPIWLYVLGNQLSEVKASFEDWKTMEEDQVTDPLNPESGIS